MKYIVICHEPFRNYMDSNFFLKEFEEKGYKVEYWAVNSVLKYSQKIEYKIEDNSNYVINFKSYPKLISKIKEINNKDIVCLEIWRNWDTIQILELLSLANPIIFSLDYYINQPFQKDPSSEIIKEMFISLDFNRILSSINVRISNLLFKRKIKAKNIFFPKLVFSPGALAESFSNDFQEYKSINHFDLYTFNSLIEDRSSFGEDYFVFIDIYLPFHPDITRAGQKSISPEKYYGEITKYLKFVEKEFDKRVIIAAHPKSCELGKYLPFPIFYGKTAELIKFSDGVFSHHSAALNFAILAKKPIQLIYTNDFLLGKGKTYLLRKMLKSILGYQNILNVKAINISKENIEPFKKYNYEKYDEYINNYILSKSKQIDNFQIIFDKLTEYN